jgi:hypothetical protein
MIFMAIYFNEKKRKESGEKQPLAGESESK